MGVASRINVQRLFSSIYNFVFYSSYHEISVNYSKAETLGYKYGIHSQNILLG